MTCVVVELRELQAAGAAKCSHDVFVQSILSCFLLLLLYSMWLLIIKKKAEYLQLQTCGVPVKLHTLFILFHVFYSFQLIIGFSYFCNP
jgi:hypothetical protein